MGARRRAAALSLLALASCRGRATSSDGGDPSPAASGSSLEPLAPPPAPPKGMVWIPPGVLLAGTPEDRLPRVADVEMPGAQVVLKGFFIDEFPYPNEAGAIPRTNVNALDAEALCQKLGKRLCSELEWERACKGPQNRVYPYGDVYRAGECGTGAISASVPPTGFLPGCRSAFGVRDTHGGVFQWTSSPWGRGTAGGLVTLRGGNAEAGEVVGRCANAIGRRSTDAQPTYGFRCCSGERNAAEVTLDIVRGEPFRGVPNEPALEAALEAAPPPEGAVAMGDPKAPFRVLQTFRWHPIGNEEIVLQTGCSQRAPHAACGVAVGRPRYQALEPLGFASSGWWLPNLRESADPRDLWVFGGDEVGPFRRRLAYTWGTVSVGPPERNTPKKKRRRD